MQVRMAVYWIMYALPAFYTLVLGTTKAPERQQHLGLAALMAVFALLIGLRYQVGTDWFNYLRAVNSISYYRLVDAFGYKDPAFGVLTWFSTHAGFGIYGANLVCGAVMMAGIAIFAKRQPDPWLAITAAVPYLVIVVGMGYTRQAAAIGFIMIGLTSLENRRLVRGLAWWLAAALFHAPSVVLLPFAGIALAWERKALILPMALAFGVMFAAVLAQRIDSFYSTYIEAEYSSSGAAVRLLMNAVPGVLYVLLRKRFELDARMQLFWLLVAVTTIGFLLIFPVFPSSTALDRVSLYLLPIQMLVFGHLPSAFGGSSAGRRLVAFISIVYYALALLVWLNFANNAHNWVPYQSIFNVTGPL
jgi:hypothetical protein